MINKIDNNCSFKANLKASIRMKDKARFDNINELFSIYTKQYPDEVLYLSRGEKNKLSLHTSNLKYNKSAQIISTDLLRVLMKNYSDREIALKFYNAFKILRLTDILNNLRKKIEYNTEKLRTNKQIANNLRNFGKEKFAEKYDLFAQFNHDKINSLNLEYKDLKNNFIIQQKISSVKLPEVMQVKF